MNGNATTGTKTSGTTAATRRGLDLLRARLRLADPSDVDEVVAALRRLYPDEALKLDAEARGQAVTAEGSVRAAPTAGAETTGARELAKARSAVEQEAEALLHDREAQELVPEIRAWRDGMLREIQQATGAAHDAADPAELEAALLSTVRLADVAGKARAAGCDHVSAMRSYRRLAGAMEDAASAVRILAGEALLDSAGILRVPLSDARERSEAVVTALERLAGLGDGATSADAEAYGKLVDDVEAGPTIELRPYLRPTQLRGELDHLLGAAGATDGTSLRGLSAAVSIELDRLGNLLAAATAVKDDATYAGSDAIKTFCFRLKELLDSFMGDAERRLADLALPVSVSASSRRKAEDEGTLLVRAVVRWQPAARRMADAHLVTGEISGVRLGEQRLLDLALWLIERAVHDLVHPRPADARDDADARAAQSVDMARAIFERVPGAVPVPATGWEPEIDELVDQLTGGLSADEYRALLREELASMDEYDRRTWGE